MRRAVFLVISVMPLIAMAQQGPISAQLSSASVLFGPGIIQDRSGEAPTPKFDTKLSSEVQIEGLNPKAKPRFRFWLVKAGDEENLKRVTPGSLKGKVLSSKAGIMTSAGYSFEMHWIKGSVDPDDRLFMEVFIGRRRAATAISAIQSHYLPVSRPRGNEENK